MRLESPSRSFQLTTYDFLCVVPSMVGIMIGSLIGVRILARAKPKAIRYIVISVLFFAGVRAFLKGFGIWFWRKAMKEEQFEKPTVPPEQIKLCQHPLLGIVGWNIHPCGHLPYLCNRNYKALYSFEKNLSALVFECVGIPATVECPDRMGMDYLLSLLRFP